MAGATSCDSRCSSVAVALLAAALLWVLSHALSGRHRPAWPRHGGGGVGGAGGGARGFVVPRPRAFGNGTVFDFVLTADVRSGDGDDGGAAVYFVGPSKMRWHWDSFYCSFRFPAGDPKAAVSVGSNAFFGGGRAALRQVQCPLPPAVVQAVRAGKMPELRFSVHEDAEGREAILQDITVPVPAEPSRKFGVVMQTMLKDEADAIVEWIEYHALLGVEHFYVYDNNSRDGLRRRLARYRCAGLVTVIDWPFLPEIKTPADPDDWPWPLVQRGAWNHFLKAYGRHARWVSFADVDEFFQPNETYADALDAGAMTLADVLDEATALPDGSAAVGIHLDMYQVNCNLRMDDVRHARYRLLIESCRQFDPVKLAQNTRVAFGKMWARSAAVPGVMSPHYLDGGLRQPSVSWPEVGRFRHYRTYRDQHALEFKGITDDSMQRYVGRLREAVIQYD